LFARLVDTRYVARDTCISSFIYRFLLRTCRLLSVFTAVCEMVALFGASVLPRQRMFSCAITGSDQFQPVSCKCFPAVSSDDRSSTP